MFSISVFGNKVNLVKVSIQLFFSFQKGIFLSFFFLILFVLLSALGRFQFSICFHARNIAFIFQPLFPTFSFLSFFLFFFFSIKVITSDPLSDYRSWWPEHKLCVHSIDGCWHHSLTFLTTTSPPSTHCLLGSTSHLLFRLFLVRPISFSLHFLCVFSVSCGHWLECFSKSPSDAFRTHCIIHALSLDCFLSLISEAKMNLEIFFSLSSISGENFI